MATVEIRNLQKLRPLGKLEQIAAVSHHLGFYHNVGVSAHYQSSSKSYSSDTDFHRIIFVALASVLRNNSVLFAIPVDEQSPDAYFARLDSIDLTRTVTFVTRSQATVSLDEDSELDAILEEQHNTDFKANYGSLPFWRLLIIQEPGVRDGFTASFIFHHAIGDGIAGLVFGREFLDALITASLTEITSQDMQILAPNDVTLLPPLESLHPLPVNSAPTQPVSNLYKEWTGGPISVPCVTRYRTLYISPTSSQALIQQCKNNGLSLTSVITSIIAKEIFNILPGDVDTLTCIIPVNLRPWLNLPQDVRSQAIGTFIDAFKVQFCRSEHLVDTPNASRIPSAAHFTAMEIQKYLTGNPSPTGEPYTAVAAFKGIPDVGAVFNSLLGNTRDAAIEVSNLGAFAGSAKVREDAPWRLGRVVFSRSSVVSGSAVTMSLVSGGDGGLTMGFSWQRGVVEDGLVDDIVGGVKRYFEGFIE